MLPGPDIRWHRKYKSSPNPLREGDSVTPIFPLNYAFYLWLTWLGAMLSPAGGRIKEGGSNVMNC